MSVSVVVAIALAMGAFQLGFTVGRLFERWDERRS
jgi:hypothetical protein